MPVRLCAEPTCSAEAQYRGRCQAHNRAKEQNTNRAGTHIYNTARWRYTRLRYLFEHPLCECGCGHIATDVHHRIDLDDGGDPWDFTNLEALTHSCHSKKTRARQR